MDGTDSSADHTARREAWEEVALPLGSHPHLHKLTELEPFLSKYKLIVFREPSLLNRRDPALKRNVLHQLSYT
jgi:8-oxo-dGTP pyrophosphatase MutT (NUDIX family)